MERDDERLTPELALLIERSAEIRRGLAFVNRAPVESVAVTLGVHPFTVDQARDRLASPALRPSILRAYSVALERRRPQATAARPRSLSGDDGV
jgi:hypothetical protein